MLTDICHQQCGCSLGSQLLQRSIKGLILLQVSHNRRWLQIRLQWRWPGVSGKQPDRIIRKAQSPARPSVFRNILGVKHATAASDLGGFHQRLGPDHVRHVCEARWEKPSKRPASRRPAWPGSGEGTGNRLLRSVCVCVCVCSALSLSSSLCASTCQMSESASPAQHFYTHEESDSGALWCYLRTVSRTTEARARSLYLFLSLIFCLNPKQMLHVLVLNENKTSAGCQYIRKLLNQHHHDVNKYGDILCIVEAKSILTYIDFSNLSVINSISWITSVCH